MIGRIQGKLLERTDTQILIDVGGVAYEIEVTLTVLEQLPASGDDVRYYTHFVVREDAQLLYGFASKLERDVFRDLIRISGVGPKLALSLISGISLEELAASVEQNDITRLTRIPGIGTKTAQRLLVELKDRLTNITPLPVTGRGADPRMVSDAESALVALGYRPADAQKAITRIRADTSPETGTEELVRLALKQIARQVEVSG
jgi:Holliday junction DNA helicase RuvA